MPGIFFGPPSLPNVWQRRSENGTAGLVPITLRSDDEIIPREASIRTRLLTVKRKEDEDERDEDKGRELADDGHSEKDMELCRGGDNEWKK